MGSSAKQQSAITKVMNLHHEWDKGSKSIRKQILQDFIAQNKNKTGPELEAEFAEAASLFLTRLTAWLRLTYMLGTCLHEQLKALQIFLSAASGHKFMAEFLEVGGILTILEILGLKQAKESDKNEALILLTIVANAGRKYKELVCESYEHVQGIRAIAECLAKSRSELTQETARSLLHTLAKGNPKFELQVYKGLIALLPCSSPKAQQMAAQTLRAVQPIVKTAVPIISEPLLNLLTSLHLEVQYEAIELMKLLMEYDIRDSLLRGLVDLLKPSREDILNLKPTEVIDDPDVPKINAPITVYVQQAAAAKAVGILAKESSEIADRIIQMRAIHSLLCAMGNVDYADSQRQASLTLELFCRNFPLVDEAVKEAMGDTLYESFMLNPEALYTTMTSVQADVLVSNKVNLTVAGIRQGMVIDTDV